MKVNRYIFSLCLLPLGAAIAAPEVTTPSTVKGLSIIVNETDSPKLGANDWPGGKITFDIRAEKEDGSMPRHWQMHYDLSKRVVPDFVPFPGLGLMHYERRHDYNPARLTETLFASVGRNYRALSAACGEQFSRGAAGGWKLTLNLPWSYFGNETPYHANGLTRWRIKVSKDDAVLSDKQVAWAPLGKDAKMKIFNDYAGTAIPGEKYADERTQLFSFWHTSASERFFFFFEPSKDSFSHGSFTSDWLFIKARLEPLFAANQNLQDAFTPLKEKGPIPAASKPDKVKEQIAGRLDAMRFLKRDVDCLRRDFLRDQLLGRKIERPTAAQTQGKNNKKVDYSSTDAIDRLGDDEALGGIELDEMEF